MTIMTTSFTGTGISTTAGSASFVPCATTTTYLPQIADVTLSATGEDRYATIAGPDELIARLSGGNWVANPFFERTDDLAVMAEELAALVGAPALALADGGIAVVTDDTVGISALDGSGSSPFHLLTAIGSQDEKGGSGVGSPAAPNQSEISESAGQAKVDPKRQSALADAQEIAEIEILEHLNKLKVEPTPFDMELYRRGHKVSGHVIAFDLDQTIVDWAKAWSSVPTERHYHYMQIKPGAIAYLAGLSRHNKVMLYTTSTSSRLVIVFNKFPALRALFDLPPGEEATAVSIDNSQQIVNRHHWSRYFIQLIERYKMNPQMSGFSEEEKMILWELSKNDSVPVNMKLSSIAGKMGKLKFDILVDDHSEVGHFFELIERDASLVSVKSHPFYQSIADMQTGINGQMSDIAKAIASVSNREIYVVKDRTHAPDYYYPLQTELIELDRDTYATEERETNGVVAELKKHFLSDGREKVKNLVIKACADGGDPWLYEGHIAIVADIAFRLAVKYGANTEIAILGAYLHDIGRAKGMLEKHDSPDAAMAARKILAEARYDELTISQIEHLILVHEGKHGGPTSLEEKIVSTADIMSHYRLDFYLTLLRRKYPFGKSDEERKEYYFRKMDKNYSLMPLEEEREAILPVRELLREAFELYYHVKDVLDQAKTFWEANQFHSAEQLVFRMLKEINEHYSPSHIAQLHDFIILPFNELSLLYSDSSADIMSAIKVAILEATARVCRELGNLEGAFLAILETSDALHARAIAFWKAEDRRRSRNVFRMVVWARLDAIETLEKTLENLLLSSELKEPEKIADLYRRIGEMYESIAAIFVEFVEIEIENSYVRQLRAYEKALAYYEKSLKFSNDPEAINFVSGKIASINQNLTRAIEKAGGDAVIEEISKKAADVVIKEASTPADYKVKADAQELLGDFKGSAISRRLGEDIRRGRNAKTD